MHRIAQTLYSQKTLHTSPLRASYGVSFVSVLAKKTRVMKGFYCIGTSTYMQTLYSCLSHEQPSLSHEQPSLSHEQPSLSHEQPSLGHEQPSLSHEQPSLSHEQPSLSHEQPSLGIRNQEFFIYNTTEQMKK